MRNNAALEGDTPAVEEYLKYLLRKSLMVGNRVRPGFWFAVWMGFVADACKLSGVFGAPGMHRVTLNYDSDTVLTEGTTVAPVVTVEADGVPVSEPRLRFVSSDPSTVQLTAAGDSLVVLKVGKDTLTVSLVDAIFTDSLPTIKQFLTIQGGPP